MAIKNKQIIVDTPFNINNNKLINVGDPTSDNDAVNLKFLNTKISSISTDYSSVLSNNTNDEEILVGNSLEDRSIIIDYVMERGLVFQEGSIRILNDGIDVYATHNFQNTANIGVSFNGSFIYTDGTITVSFDVDNSGNNVTIKYIVRKIKI